MVSLKARFFIFMLKLAKKKQALMSAENLMAAIKVRRAEQDHRPAEKTRARLDIEERNIGGYPTFIIKPKGLEAPKDYVFYLHGGAYTFEIIQPHWVFLADMAEMLQACIMVPIYPLAPEHNADEALEYVHKAHREFEEDFAGKTPIHMMGDSAGAGMLVAMTQQMVKVGWTPAKSLILISPFVDCVLADPEVPALDKIDPWLSRDGLREAGRLYAGALDVRDPRVSPLYGSVDGLPPVHVFIGTRDILLPSVKAFSDKISAAKGRITYHQYEGMFHVWPLVGAPESHAARREIKQIIDAG